MHLFCTEINFLGHQTSACSIEGDNKKVEKIVNWPIPKSAMEAWSFLGLVRYLADFLSSLAEYTGILTELTIKEAKKMSPPWTDCYQSTFDSVKNIVISRKCLITIDLTMLPEYKIFVTIYASNKCLGAVLSFGKSWSSAWPVTFDSMTFKGAELNYPVHEKALLAIIRTLKKWWTDLLGSPFFIYTDHKTLENFNTQKDLSCRQARWMELMLQYDAKIVYIKGDDNSVAETLSHLLCEETTDTAERSAQHPYHYCEDECSSVACISSGLSHTPWEAATALADGLEIISVSTTLNISTDKLLLQEIWDGYTIDPWCKKLPSTTASWPDLQLRDGLWYVGNQLIIPHTGSLCELLFQLAHDTLGHFGFDKMYGSLRLAYYWPNICHDLEKGYVVLCPECQWNKSSTSKLIGPLHLLPIPDQCGDSVAIDFISPLPEDNSFNCIIGVGHHGRCPTPSTGVRGT